jgi:cellulose synthase/poly-beta-1,6-N-acetylglucosamine synthase-like glycosyltransferase
VQVMPGAGSCYKREVLIQIFFQHTGLRSGEDREITVVGFRRGYKVFYMKHVLALTRPPLTFRKLVKQRVRWNLGYLETFYKERFFYLEEMGKINVFGLLTFLNFLRVLFLVCFPWLVLATAVLAISYLPWLLAATYLGYLANVVFWMWVSPAESAEIGKKRWKAVMLFPFYAVGVESLAWTRALLVFRRKTVLNRIENVKHAEHVVAS